MRFALARRGLILGVLFGGVSLPAAGLPADERAAEKINFNRQIRPILADRCFRCHGPDARHRQAELRLDTFEGATADLGERRAVVPGKPADSELLIRVETLDASERMPPPEAGEPLSAQETRLLRQWVEEGAAYQPHWSYIPPRRPAVPSVKNGHWPSNAVDRFVLSRLEREGIAPSPETDRVTLLRRLSFDLSGLPPTSQQVVEFLADSDPRAYERMVEKFLESPHFGERMAMYWLDLVRYADTVGYHGDQEHPATAYRDWVIKAFNDNMPFDRFTIEQLAGDLLPDATIDQKIASGYNRLLQTSHEGGVQVKEYLHKYDADRLRNLGSVWMGATLGCVECHDHKFDPYTQRDYYSLVAVFADVDDLRSFKGGDTNPTKREPEIVVLSPLDRDRLAGLADRLQQLESQQAGLPPDDSRRERLAQQIEMLRRESEALEKQTRRAMVTEAIAPKTVRVLSRGDWMDEAGEVVEAGLPGFLAPPTVADRRLGRLDLARWLTSADHPQTGRVFVNRLWYLFFGNGLSNTLEDAGSQGEWPSHPELLDWLAVRFASGDAASSSDRAVPAWDVKSLVRLLVTSAAYRQSSRERAELHERDPHNRLYARQNSTRLPAEMIRDNALAVSGLLVDRLGGPSGHPYQPAGYYKYLNFPKREYQADADENQYRRGVYTHWQRQYLHPMLKAFDAPSREECTARRQISNTPLAALALLNDPSFVEAARVYAARIVREGGPSDNERLRWAWNMALSRAPTDSELTPLAQLLASERDFYRDNATAADQLLNVGLAPRPEGAVAAELAAWTGVARALLNLHESITRY